MPPDFIIAGAPRSGTTWLYWNLSQNPRLFLTANKEPRFYAVEEADLLNFRGPGDEEWLSHFVQDRTEYEALYAEARADQLTGEASSDYLYRSSVAAKRIRSELPAARLIFILRDPTDRAVSNWTYQLLHERETASFGEALADESRRIESSWAWWWHYAARGFYAQQLEHFFSTFPHDQILIILYDEIRRDPQGVLKRVSSFLGVEPVIAEGSDSPANVSSMARSRAHGAVRRLLKNTSLARTVLPRRLRAQLGRTVDRVTLHRPSPDQQDYLALRALYADDVKRLESMTGLDLSEWRN